MVKKVISKEAKPKRVVTNLKPNKKAPTKSELECQVKNLQLANDALEESNRQKIKLLESFEAKISNLENQIEYLSHKDIMHSKETQTEANLNLKCDECNFEAEYERELGWHMGKVHGWPSEQKGETMDISLQSMDPRNCDKCGYEAESLYVLDAHIREVHDESIECNFCDESFENQGEQMKHKKEEHTEKVDICWNYAGGKCDFEEGKCWFLHKDETTSRFECTSCDKTFAAQAKLRHHNKRNHIDSVPTCKYMIYETCKYGSKNCWFNHGEGETSTMNENDKKLNDDTEVIEKIFQMMEKFTQQIVKMKEINNLK